MAAERKILSVGFASLCALLATGAAAPKWLVFLTTMAASHGIAVLGVVVLTRGGGATFGQGLFFAVGAYTAALTAQHLHLSDALLRVLMGGLVAGALGAAVAPLLARYRGIFFAMLTLALSMVVYGLLSKSMPLGGTDGFNLARPTFFGYAPEGADAQYATYVIALVVSAASALLVWVHFRSSSGLISLAVRNNALRLEYLGASAQRSLAKDFALCSALGGLGGALTGIALGHVDPQLAYWTTSGEFVFAAILGGYQSVIGVFIASFILEIVRSFSSLYFPNSWQLALGIFLLAVVLIRPAGIGSLWFGHNRRKRAKQSALRQLKVDEAAP